MKARIRQSQKHGGPQPGIEAAGYSLGQLFEVGRAAALGWRPLSLAGVSLLTDGSRE